MIAPFPDHCLCLPLQPYQTRNKDKSTLILIFQGTAADDDDIG